MGSGRKKRSRAKARKRRRAAASRSAERQPEAAAKADPPRDTPRSAMMQRWVWPFCGLLAWTLALFGFALGGDFLRWDDNTFVTANPIVHTLNGDNVWTLLTTLHQQVYTPLHHLANAVQYSLWGAWAPGFHAVNLLVFAVGLTVLYRVLVRLGTPPLAAILATGLYAAHPSHVESVAWVTGLKDVLSFAFAMGATLLHLPGKAPGERRRPYLSFALFAAAVLSKNTLIVLPALLLLLDWVVVGSRLRQAALRVLPHAAVVAALVPVVSGRWKAKEITRPDSTPLLARVGDSYGHYLRSVLWPFDLSPLYPARLARGWTAQAVVGLVAPLLLAALCLVKRWWRPLLALAWFLAALLPMANIVPLYYRVNDRYLILPTLSLALVAAWWLTPQLGGRWREVSDRLRRQTGARVAVAVTLALGLAWAGLSVHLTRAWTSDRTLWSLATRRQPDSYYAWLKRGETSAARGAYADALQSYSRAVRLVKLPSGFLRLFSTALQQALPRGQQDRAYKPLLAGYARVMARPPQLLALASVLEQKGLHVPAWAALFTARQLAPQDVEVRLRLASSWLKRRRPKRALRLLRTEPADADQRRRHLTYKVIALRGAKRYAEATRLLARARKDFPDDPVLKKLSVSP